MIEIISKSPNYPSVDLWLSPGAVGTDEKARVFTDKIAGNHRR